MTATERLRHHGRSVEAGQLGAFLRHPIQVRRGHIGRAVAAEVIGEDDDEIGLRHDSRME
jgi:hypothetical protein